MNIYPSFNSLPINNRAKNKNKNVPDKREISFGVSGGQTKKITNSIKSGMINMARETGNFSRVNVNDVMSKIPNMTRTNTTSTMSNAAISEECHSIKRNFDNTVNDNRSAKDQDIANLDQLLETMTNNEMVDKNKIKAAIENPSSDKEKFIKQTEVGAYAITKGILTYEEMRER